MWWLLVGALVDQPTLPPTGLHLHVVPELTVGVSAGTAFRGAAMPGNDIVGPSFGAHAGLLFGGFGPDVAWTVAEWGYNGRMGDDEAIHILGFGLRWEGFPEWRVRPSWGVHGGPMFRQSGSSGTGIFIDAGLTFRLRDHTVVGFCLSENVVNYGPAHNGANVPDPTSNWFGISVDLGSLLRL